MTKAKKMKKIVLLFVFGLFMFSLQAQEPIIDDIDIKVDLKEKKLIITLKDPQVTTYDLVVYRTFEDVILYQNNLKDNPIIFDISTWKPGMYHFKFDYNHITQFRHFELVPLD